MSEILATAEFSSVIHNNEVCDVPADEGKTL